eukprot:scaffold67728_cov28-Tisochrysis_lutea.AAC.7
MEEAHFTTEEEIENNKIITGHQECGSNRAAEVYHAISSSVITEDSPRDGCGVGAVCARGDFSVDL